MAGRLLFLLLSPPLLKPLDAVQARVKERGGCTVTGPATLRPVHACSYVAVLLTQLQAVRRAHTYTVHLAPDVRAKHA